MKVSLYHASSDAMVEEVRAAFELIGLDAEVVADWNPPPPPEEEAWGANGGAYIPLVVAFALGGFFRGFAEAAGADAWRSCKTWSQRVFDGIKRTYGYPPDTPAALTVEDGDGHQVLIEESMPDDAYQALYDIEWSEIDTGGWLEWDAQDRAWRLRRITPLPPPRESWWRKLRR